MLLAAVAPLAAQNSGCSYTLTAPALVLPGSSAQQISGTAGITTGTTCTWTVATTASWIHIPSITVTGSGTFSFTVDTNTGTTMRQDVLTFSFPGVTSTLTTTVYQFTATCVYTLSPTTAEIAVGGGSGTLQVTTGCSWSETSSQSWLTAVSDKNNLYAGTVNSATNYGTGNVNYTVAANGCVASRNANLTVATSVPGTQPVLAITQDGSPNNLSLSQTTLNTSASATTGRITVTTGDGCSWSASSNANWLQITGTSSGTGLSSFAYSVLANTGPLRTGTIQVGPQTFTVTQQAVPAPTPQVTSVLNGASYASGAVSPGEIVALFGTNMGPAVGVAYQLSADGKSIPYALAGVQVLFGATPATLLYVSATQINAIVPYAVAGNASIAVQVQYSGQTSSAMTLAVQAATPGIFSQDRTGSGPGAIVNNQDSSLNASLSPATVGSFIQIYATGGGVTSPAQTDGALAPVTEPLPRITALPVSVTIGGVPAQQVPYSGAAPGEIAGLTQIDVLVPAGVTPGLSVPVVVQIGTWQSQASLTITVK
jgi:uncharacterized protein (TIGR03437 family)